MCGISGIYHRDGTTSDVAVIERMVTCLRHRGPDDSGMYVSGPFGLGHTRLSIIDLSVQGHQPMWSDDRRFVIAYNGETYNFKKIRGTLVAKGHRFRGHSDTEVVLHAYMEWGIDAFMRFEGMFALALWDAQEQRLLLARDRFGIKPLYYHCTPSTLVFSSEIKALLACGKVPARVDWAGVHEYLHFRTALGSRTLFEGISKLLPGHLLTLDAAGVRVEPYVSIFNVEPIVDDLPTATHRVRALFERAVKEHLVSDVPVGVFLSGGIDSSAITAFARKHYSGGHLQTFSVGFDTGVNELSMARMVAQDFETDHHELHISGADITATIERLVRCHDAPFGDPASIPLYLLSEQLGGSIKVILQGDGGDEIFGGYPHYQYETNSRWLHLLARSTRWTRPFVPRWGALYRKFCALQTFNHSAIAPSLHMALMMSEAPPDYSVTQLFAPAVRAQLEVHDPFNRYKEQYYRFENLDSVQRMLYTDCSILLPDVYFEKVDRATMAHSIESRVPMMDTRMVAYVTGLPSTYKVRTKEKKYIFRQALRGMLPDAILDRPKTGFSVPMADWLRTSLSGYMQAVLLDSATQRSGLFDQAVLMRCIEEHVSSRRNYGKLLYKLLNLALWYTVYGL